jgi:hypothetical protein
MEHKNGANGTNGSNGATDPMGAIGRALASCTTDQDRGALLSAMTSATPLGLLAAGMRHIEQRDFVLLDATRDLVKALNETIKTQGDQIRQLFAERQDVLKQQEADRAQRDEAASIIAQRDHDRDMESMRQARITQLGNVAIATFLPALKKRFGLNDPAPVAPSSSAPGSPPTSARPASAPPPAGGVVGETSPVVADPLRAAVAAFVRSLDDDTIMRVMGVLSPEQSAALSAIFEVMQ